MKNQKLFEKYKAQKHWHGHSTEYAQRFADFLRRQDFRGVVVDLGCGNGRDVAIFKKAGFESVGIDKSKQEIAQAKKLHPDSAFAVQNIQNLPWKNESVNAMFMINVIHYLDERQALAEIFRTLRVGGYLYLHINLSITDKKGNVDYQGYDLQKTVKSIPRAKIISWEYLERIDAKPKWHKHQILEIILQKD
ncbi:MAG TPA: class I SAM-dependent methyltransferase [Candidatus Uhrbacteria bacterium]|nr:class I SAM-dependent methyltransferase [Candidatus Uhrbacteria bacterium]